MFRLKMEFKPLQTTVNPDGWGPTQVLPEIKALTNPNFDRTPMHGKIVDWTGYLRFQGKYSQGGMMLPKDKEDESEKFELVAGQLKPQKPTSKLVQRNRQQNARRQLQQRQMLKQPQQQQKKNQKHFHYRRPWQNKINKDRESSIEIKPSWSVVEEMEFVRMQKLSWPQPSTMKDLVSVGELEKFDRAYDRISYKMAKTLKASGKAIYFPPKTTDDAIIRRIVKSNPEVNVFATDRVISALMACGRSVYPFHIVATRVANKLFLEKREDSRLDQLTVNETAWDPPADDAAKPINNPKQLSQEATLVNGMFIQQALKHNEKPLTIGDPYPYDVEQTEKIPVHGYKYRKFVLNDDKEKNITIAVRCTIDGAIESTKPGNPCSLMNITTVTEWDPTHHNNVSWRERLDTQFGSILATEMKNNNFRLARWTISSILAGVDVVRMGFVTRQNFRDPSKHLICGVQQFRPTELVTNINLNIDNCWGILNYIIQRCMEQEAGNYILVKDPNKPVIRLYNVPNEDELDAEDEDDDDDLEVPVEEELED